MRPLPEIVEEIANFTNDSDTMFALLDALHRTHALGNFEPLRRLGLILPRQALWPSLCAVLDARPGEVDLSPDVFDVLQLVPIASIRSRSLDTSSALVARLAPVLPSMHHLRRLELTSLADVTAVDLLFGALPGSTITELVLEGVNEMHYRHDREQILSDVAVHGMSSWLERSAKPTTLCLDKLVFQCALPVAERFMRALQESMLTSIQLHHCRHQMALAFPPTLVHLALSDTRSSAESEQRVIDALGDPASQLRTLDLSWYSMSSRTLSLLATSIPSSTLILLDVSYTCLLDRGAVALASSLPHTCLQDVHLGYNEITNVGGEMLATALKDAPTLRKLHLQGNFLGESGMAALVQVATTRPEPVEWVDLTNNDKFFFTALVRVHAMYRRLSQQYSSTCVVLLDKCDLPQHR